MVQESGIEIDEETLELIKQYNYNIGLDGKGPTNDDIKDWEQYLKNSEGLGALSILHNGMGQALGASMEEPKTRAQAISDAAMGLYNLYKYCVGE